MPDVAQQAYIKASNVSANHRFGVSVALSADGSTLAVGADLGDIVGTVYVFTHNGATWSQQALIKASNAGESDYFGSSIALSANGSTLAVGAYGEDSAATGINGDQNDNSAPTAGAAYVFTRSGTTWSQQAYVKSSNAATEDWFGSKVTLSADGSTLAVSAPMEDIVIDGTNAADVGAIYVFTRAGTTWSQQAYAKAFNANMNDHFGNSLALSPDGSTLAVGAIGEDSDATGIDGDPSRDIISDAGAVYVFTRTGTTWSQQAYVKASNTGDRTTGEGDNFGSSVALSHDGSILAVGAYWEDSAATGIGGNQGDNSATDAGAVYMFERSGTTWWQQAYVKASNTGAGDYFGISVALSADGSALAVGAYAEDSATTGVNGAQTDESAPASGAIYWFTRSGTTWSQQAYVKASNTGPDDLFGQGLALSADGSTLAVGAHQEDSAARGIGGAPSDNSAMNAGAVYVFRHLSQ